MSLGNFLIAAFTTLPSCAGRRGCPHLLLAEYFEKTRTTHRPVVVTQNGRATTVIVNLGDWEQAFATWEEAKLTREVLKDFEISKEQFKRGEGIPHKQVMAEMREKSSTAPSSPIMWSTATPAASFRSGTVQ